MTHVLCLAKTNGQKFVFLYDDPDAALQQIGRCAADPELDFSWYDAAVLSMRVRKTAKESV